MNNERRGEFQTHTLKMGLTRYITLICILTIPRNPENRIPNEHTVNYRKRHTHIAPGSGWGLTLPVNTQTKG